MSDTLYIIPYLVFKVSHQTGTIILILRPGNANTQVVLVPWSATTTYHSLSGLNKRSVFLTVLQAVKSNSKASVDLVSGKGLFLVHRHLSSHSVLI
jgi:hypothetical protein